MADNFITDYPASDIREALNELTKHAGKQQFVFAHMKDANIIYNKMLQWNYNPYLIGDPPQYIEVHYPNTLGSTKIHLVDFGDDNRGKFYVCGTDFLEDFKRPIRLGGGLICHT